MSRKILSAVILLLMLAVTYTAVFAHAELESSTPAPGETVTTLPSQIRLVFSGTVKDVSILLVHDDATYQTIVDNTIPLASFVGKIDGTLEAGLYQVVWTANSTDGHNMSGSYQFEYAPPEEEASSSLLFVAGGVGAVILIGAFFSSGNGKGDLLTFGQRI